MTSLCWNCRGIGNPQTVFALREYLRCWNPKLVFLSETKLKSRRMEKVKYKLGFSNGLFVSSRGRRAALLCSGLVILFWILKATQTITLMRLLSILAMVFCGGSPGFMGIQRLILGKILGNSFLFSIVNIIFPSFVVVISMKFFQ